VAFFLPLAFILGVLALRAPGPLSMHMIVHVFTMGAAAPVLASILWHRRQRLGQESEEPRLLVATVIQLAVFCLWHTPAFMAAAMSDLKAATAMQVSLFIASVNYWLHILRMDRRKPWLCAASLTVTGKVLCLLAAVMLFAPQPAFHLGHAAAPGASLHDQQMAGLIMLSICPLVYVISGIVLIARWFIASCRPSAPAAGGS
jgi:putative membrane protein